MTYTHFRRLWASCNDDAAPLYDTDLYPEDIEARRAISAVRANGPHGLLLWMSYGRTERATAAGLARIIGVSERTACAWCAEGPNARRPEGYTLCLITYAVYMDRAPHSAELGNARHLPDPDTRL